MKTTAFRLLAILLAAAMFAMIPAGCGTQPVPQTTQESPREEQQPPSGEEQPAPEGVTYPYTVTDQAGRNVTIEKKYERVAFSSVRPLPAAYFAVTGNIDTLVGMNPSSLTAAQVSMFSVLCPEILSVETGFVTGNETNIEELMKLNPEIVFCLNTNSDEITALEAVGITAVGLETNGTDAIEIFAQWAELIGQVMGEQNRAAEIIDYSREVAQQVKTIAATIPQNERKTALFLYQDEGGTIRVGGSNLYSQYWIETIGAVNAAAGVNNVAEVSMEQIMSWNPEYIFITNFTTVQPDDLLGNKIEGQDWSQIKAVKDGNVYKNPLGTYRWFTPTSDSALMLKWVAQKVYPDYYNSYDIVQEVKDHYQTYYGYALNEKELEMIFKPSSDAAYYIKN